MDRFNSLPTHLQTSWKSGSDPVSFGFFPLVAVVFSSVGLLIFLSASSLSKTKAGFCRNNCDRLMGCVTVGTYLAHGSLKSSLCSFRYRLWGFWCWLDLCVVARVGRGCQHNRSNLIPSLPIRGFIENCSWGLPTRRNPLLLLLWWTSGWLAWRPVTDTRAQGRKKFLMSQCGYLGCVAAGANAWAGGLFKAFMLLGAMLRGVSFPLCGFCRGQTRAPEV